jgi:pimeloyl-ACP methyl ester carboxylesterase
MRNVPALLLLHGSGDDGACWGPFVTRLLREDGLAALRVATPDAPAHGGRRAQPGQTIAWPDLLGDALGHVQALADRTSGRIVVGGHSMGAMTALGVAAHRPDLVAATFLEDPPLFAPLGPPDAAAADAEPVDLTEFHEWFSDLQARPLADVVAGVRAQHPTWDEAEYEPWARAKQAVDVAAFAAPAVFVHAETAHLIRAAATPVVVAAGEPGRGGMLAETAAVDLAALPGWTIHRLPTGHDVRRDAPEQTAALLAGLIRTVQT